MCFVVLSLFASRSEIKQPKTQTAVVLCLFALRRFITLIDVLQFCVLCLFLRSFVDFNGFLFVAQQTTACNFLRRRRTYCVCVFFGGCLFASRRAHTVHTYFYNNNIMISLVAASYFALFLSCL